MNVKLMNIMIISNHIAIIVRYERLNSLTFFLYLKTKEFP